MKAERGQIGPEIAALRARWKRTFSESTHPDPIFASNGAICGFPQTRLRGLVMPTEEQKKI
jgi:hypothetical protein